MRKTLLSILVGMALVTPTDILLAEPKSPKLAKCNGKHRRPANPYGSILPTVGTSTPSNQQQSQGRERGGVDVFPDKAPTSSNPVKPEAKPATQVPPISSASPPASYRSC
ncbi:hypothetical protein [Sphingorhabdus sp.]|uniref:hypothetical protein n=1 Tax=Sphingorhabdus sp. TaxID=1902408 RepID=UPI00333E9721